MRAKERSAALARARKANPFVSDVVEIGGRLCHSQAIDVDSRLHRLKTFDAAQCRAALKLRLQKTVRTAIERRLRKLDKEASP